MLSPIIPVRTILLESPEAYIFLAKASLVDFYDTCNNMEAVLKGPVNTVNTIGPDILINFSLS